MEPDFSKSWLLGTENPEKIFNRVPENTCDDKLHYLHRRALAAWLDMFAEAEKAGISLQIISSFRSFERQREIWENKWFGRTAVQGLYLDKTHYSDTEKALLILKYSAMPGTSRHHWGVDMDINSVEDEYFEQGRGADEFEWLEKNAGRFGFARPYTDKSAGRSGYEEEKWHWSFMELSRPMLKGYVEKIDYQDLTNFAGSETAQALSIISEYVCGISPECK